MFSNNFSVYLGETPSIGYSGFLSENNFYLVLNIEEGIDIEEGQKIIKVLRDEMLTKKFDKMIAFESYITEIIKQLNLPTNISISAGYANNNIIYLRTIGDGEIYIRRNNKFIKLIDEDNTASGYIQANDLIIFTTKKFTKYFNSIDDFKRNILFKEPQQIVESLIPLIKSQDDQGVIALFNSFLPEIERTKEDEIIVSTPTSAIGFKYKLSRIYSKLHQYSNNASRGKRITFALVIIITLILVWSVGFGYIRRMDNEANKNIQLTKELITQKLNEAEEIAYINVARAMNLISESKNEVGKLKTKYGKSKANEINELDKLIKEKENIITKKEEKQSEEFYDLAVDSKNATGDILYLDGDKVLILDKNNETIYTLSLNQKSLDKTKFVEIKNAELIASYQDNLFFTNPQGIFQINNDNKIKKAIDKDQAWGKIISMWIYNGNIYLLDQLKDEIYKHLVVDGGYSSKISYFSSGQSISLNEANSLAIDSSIYIGFKDHIAKYTGGDRDEFNTSFTDSNIKITKVFTNKDLEKVFAWDRTKGAIYVLGKNGAYEREINSSILKKASDFIVYNNAAYILLGSKIYLISVN